MLSNRPDESNGGNGFDIVIGNPPYVVTNDYVYHNYFTYDSFELYAYFFEKGIELSKTGGVLTYITSSLYIKGVKYESLRKFLEMSTQLIEFVNQGDNVFENVSMPTATFVGRKGKGNWSCLELNPLTKVALKISKNQKKLEDISDIMRGLEIGRDMVLNNGDIPCVTGTTVVKYVPKEIKYISKRTLHEYSKATKYFTKERILLRETGRFLLAVYLDKLLYSNRSLYSIIITNNCYSTKYVVACLNSHVSQFYYETMFKTDTELFPKIRIAQAKQLPISTATTLQQRPIIELVDDILKAKKSNPQADTSRQEQEIDFLVYKLYGLTYDEVLIVDPETAITREEYEKQ